MIRIIASYFKEKPYISVNNIKLSIRGLNKKRKPFGRGFPPKKG